MKKRLLITSIALILLCLVPIQVNSEVLPVPKPAQAPPRPAVHRAVDAFPVTADSGLLWLVNPEHPLGASYRPEELVDMSGYLIRPEVRAAYEKMISDMEVAGINPLCLQSAYRPYGYQQALFDDKVKVLRGLGYDECEAKALGAKSVALPGTSEHQLGLAVDVSVNGKLSAHFGSTRAGVWLQNNCGRYGFIVRYPKEKTQITRIVYEPWHLRYVGIPHALYMHEHNMCLEEYITHVKDAGIVLYWVDEGNYYKVSFFREKPDHLSLETADVSGIGVDISSGYIATELKTFFR